MKILISGFPTFSNLSKNPSEELLKIIECDNNEIFKVLIPVVWNEGFKKLDEKIKEINPDVVIMMGAAGRSKFNFENVAKNKRGLELVDNNNSKPNNEKIIENGKDELYATIDPNIFLNTFHDFNIPCEISSDAGTYICNETFYKCLYNYPNIKAIFVHIPTLIPLDEALALGTLGFKEVLNNLK